MMVDMMVLMTADLMVAERVGMMVVRMVA